MRQIFLLVLMAFTQPVFAAEDFCGTGKPHKIDVWFEQVMAQTEGVTSDIRNVQGEAYSRWDKELNRIYTELMNGLDNKDDKKRLREAQKAWIKFRDAEVELLWAEALYGGEEGTLAPVAVSDIGRFIVRERVCTLLKYLKTAKGSGMLAD